VINLLAPDTGEDVESRPAVGLDLLGRHDAQHDAFAAEIEAVLAASGGGCRSPSMSSRSAGS
jgi:hypothetical protein